MKRFVITLTFVLVSLIVMRAGDRPVTFDKLPHEAQKFIHTYFSSQKVTLATIDDDLVRPEYQVNLANGVIIEFENNGKLEKIQDRSGNIPKGIVPGKIIDTVMKYYPDEKIVEYEVGRKSYEVQLSNKVEIQFDSRFNVTEVDN